MSEREPESESEQGGFRASANEDPHGTRTIAMALSPDAQQRAGLSDHPAVAGPLLFAGVFIAAFGRSFAVGSVSAWGFLPAVPIAGILVAAAIHSSRRPRLQITKRALIVKAKGQTRAIAWRDVEHFVSGEDAVRASVRVGTKAEEFVAFFAPKTKGAGVAKAPLFVGGADVELANGTRVAVGIAAAIVGVALAGFGTWVGHALGVNAAWWIGGLAVLYVAMTAWTLSRSRVTARSEGLWTNGRLVPWRAIEGAAPRVTEDRTPPSQIRVYLEANEELTLSVGAAADTAVTEILRRRDLARAEAEGRE